MQEFLASTNFTVIFISLIGIKFLLETYLKIRNLKSIELNKSLIKEGYEVKTYDPFINSEEELSKIMEFSNNILISTHHKIFDSYDFTDKKVVIVGDK